jgi:WD domain, G-beta repeat.
VFNENKRVRSICINDLETYIVSAGEDCKVIIWQLEKDSDPIVLEQHTSMIKSAVITYDQQFIVSLADDKLMIR